MNQYYQLNYLSNDFYTHYNSKDFPEIENKQSRSYMVLLIHIGNNMVPVYHVVQKSASMLRLKIHGEFNKL